MKVKKQRFYLISIMLIISGLILLLTDIYSKGPVDTAEMSRTKIQKELQNQAGIYPWTDIGPEYIIRNNSEYEFCKLSYCWSFNTNTMEPLNLGQPYLMPLQNQQINILSLGTSNSNFSLNYVEADVLLCSTNGCWLIREGVNNLTPYDKFNNASGVCTAEFLKLKPLIQ